MNAPTLRHPSVAGLRRQRAASLKTVWSHRLSSLATRIWSALETTARLHAAPDLLREASRLQATDPGIAASLRALAGATNQPDPRAATQARAA
jgi:hypothetical protein